MMDGWMDMMDGWMDDVHTSASCSMLSLLSAVSHSICCCCFDDENKVDVVVRMRLLGYV